MKVTIERIQEAKEYLSKNGYGTGTNFTLSAVANLMEEWRIKKLPIHDVSGRSEQLCQSHDWVKHPSHPKIGAMICRNCRTELA
jgi:hypothetical protein